MGNRSYYNMNINWYITSVAALVAKILQHPYSFAENLAPVIIENECRNVFYVLHIKQNIYIVCENSVSSVKPSIWNQDPGNVDFR